MSFSPAMDARGGDSDDSNMKPLKPLAVLLVALSIFTAAGTASAASPFKKVSGGLVHVSSGVIFPSRVGVFRFEGTKIYGSAGRDVGAEYDVEPLIRGDVYVYAMGTYGKDFNAELRVQQNAINKLNKAVKMVSQSRSQLNQAGRNVTGVRFQYELTRPIFRNKARRCGSQLYVFRDDPWLVADRFSYPIEQTAVANKQIADFLRLWQWRVHGRITQLEQFSTDGHRS
jgi:hypothetical protein